MHLDFTPTPPDFLNPRGGYRSTTTGRYVSRAYVERQLALWWTSELQQAWTFQTTLAALMLQASAQEAVRQQQVKREVHIVVDSDGPVRRKLTPREQEDERRQELWNKPIKWTDEQPSSDLEARQNHSNATGGY